MADLDRRRGLQFSTFFGFIPRALMPGGIRNRGRDPVASIIRTATQLDGFSDTWMLEKITQLHDSDFGLIEATNVHTAILALLGAKRDSVTRWLSRPADQRPADIDRMFGQLRLPTRTAVSVSDNRRDAMNSPERFPLVASIIVSSGDRVTLDRDACAALKAAVAKEIDDEASDALANFGLE